MTFFSGNPPLGATQVRLGSFDVEVAGRRVSFTFPDSGNMRTLVQRVLAGQEYPLLRLPGYSPALIVDVGANVGASALFFARAYPQARVVCYEPSPTNLGFLRQNTAGLPNIQVFGFGLHDHEETVRLFTGKTQSMQHSLVRNVETTENFENATVKSAIAELQPLTSAGVSILKLDTEGSEVPILTDLRPMLSSIDLIYVEYHSEQDRREIDALTADHFTMAIARAMLPHRGTNVYVAKRMSERWPILDAARIARS